MADESLKWALDFNLQGDGLRQANAGVSQLLQGLTDGRKGMVEFEAAGARMRVSLDGTAAATERAGGGMKALRDLAGGAMAAVGMLTTALAAGGVALNKFGDTAIEAFGERTSTLRAYTTLLGDAGQAAVEFAKAQQLAMQTDLTSAQTEGAQKSLMVAGFRGRQLDQALLATMDVSSMAAPAERQMTMERVSRGLSQIFAKGKLQGEEIRQLSEAGLSRGLLNQELMRSGFGKNSAQVEKNVSGGKVGADAGIAAIERAILAQFGTKRLGDYATGSAGSVQSLISNRDEAFKNLLKSFDNEVLPGMVRYKQALTEQGQQLSLTSTEGKQLSLVLQDFADTSLSLKAVWTEFTSGFVSSFTESYVAVRTELGISADAHDRAGLSAHNLGEVVGRVGKLFGYLTTALESLEPIILKITKATGWVGNIGGGMGAYKKLLSGDFRGFMDDSNKGRASFEEAWNETADGLKAKRDAKKQDQARAAMASDLEAGGAGAVMGGGAAAASPWLGSPLKNLGPKKGAAGGGAGGGGKGAGSGGGWSVSFDGSGGGAVEVANYASDLATSLAGSPAVGGEGARIEHVEIIIQGAGLSAEAIAEAVEDRLLRRLGRYQRTPSPGRS